MKEENGEKLIDIKGTLEQFVKADEPEMSQEEAIIKYKEENKKRHGTADDTDTTEEQEHLKRVKQELLASLERVKKLEKQIFFEKDIEDKKKMRIEKTSSSGRVSQKAKENELQQEANNQKERE